jgi:hypothetical protein
MTHSAVRPEFTSYHTNGSTINDINELDHGIAPFVYARFAIKEYTTDIVDSNRNVIRELCKGSGVQKALFSATVNCGLYKGDIYNKTTGKYDLLPDGQYYFKITAKGYVANTEPQVIYIPFKIMYSKEHTSGDDGSGKISNVRITAKPTEVPAGKDIEGAYSNWLSFDVKIPSDITADQLAHLTDCQQSYNGLGPESDNDVYVDSTPTVAESFYSDLTERYVVGPHHGSYYCKDYKEKGGGSITVSDDHKKVSYNIPLDYNTPHGNLQDGLVNGRVFISMNFQMAGTYFAWNDYLDVNPAVKDQVGGLSSGGVFLQSINENSKLFETLFLFIDDVKCPFS